MLCLCSRVWPVWSSPGHPIGAGPEETARDQGANHTAEGEQHNLSVTQLGILVHCNLIPVHFNPTVCLNVCPEVEISAVCCSGDGILMCAVDLVVKAYKSVLLFPADLSHRGGRSGHRVASTDTRISHKSQGHCSSLLIDGLWFMPIRCLGKDLHAVKSA